MKLVNSQITVNIKLETKEDLLKLTNALILNDISNYVVTEETSTIGSYKLNGEVTRSTVPNGYVVTIYSRNFNVVKSLVEVGLLNYE